MHIQVIGDESISRQARTYAEYRLFAALSEVFSTPRIDSAFLSLSARESPGGRTHVVCAVAIATDGGECLRIRTRAAHPYAAINSAVARIRERAWPAHLARPRGERTATESFVRRD
jgi:ribosome-associated translation inhibitor RaiA